LKYVAKHITYEFLLLGNALADSLEVLQQWEINWVVQLHTMCVQVHKQTSTANAKQRMFDFPPVSPAIMFDFPSPPPPAISKISSDETQQMEGCTNRQGLGTAAHSITCSGDQEVCTDSV
jgi:hypothetical protein